MAFSAPPTPSSMTIETWPPGPSIKLGLTAPRLSILSGDPRRIPVSIALFARQIKGALGAYSYTKATRARV
jgi:hypothetical protein